jgi:GH15 family glucan-1,4-alpha-glucosidase
MSFQALSAGDQDFEQTRLFWQQWVSRCNYRGRWSEMIYRSAITLKLLTFHPTGAMVASPTMGLPESPGGNRNWDYRYTWIRDASFTLYGLMRIGYMDEAIHFMNWIDNLCGAIDISSERPLHVMYGIRGEVAPQETELRHLKGYKGARPVRAGNDANTQFQLDIYGEFMDTVYLYNKHAMPVSHKLWEDCRKLMDWLSKHWDKPDAGIWESRGQKRRFVYSRLMCWVALDRASRMSLKHSLPGSRFHWMTMRDQIYDEIMDKGWNSARGAFRQDYDSNDLDASCLLMPMMKFISPKDPRMLSTIDAILKDLTMDNLVYRYDPRKPLDNLSGEEGTFSMCTFWLVESLARAGRLQTARFIFEKMLGYANHLGLYAEEIGPHGEALGNFPQAFTHLGLISAAHFLSRTINAHDTK